MASIMQTQFKPPLPAPAQIAFALVVLNSKPREASIEDYLAHLRGRIVDGCAPTIELVAQHLDGAGYWKEAFDKAEEEKTALLDRVHDLEKKKASATLLSSPVVRSPLPGKRKRRREDTPAAIANSRSKRQANSSRASKSPADHDTPRGCGEAIEAGGVSGHTAKLLQQFFTLRLDLKCQPPARSAIQVSARRLCHTISMTVRSLDVNSKSEKNRGDDFTDVWSAIQRTYGTILEAVELLQAHGTSAGSAKTLISELVKILTELLKHLQSIAAQKQPQRRGLRKRSKSRDIDTQIGVLTDFISSMMLDLKFTKSAHRELFEGLLCTFLDHLGSNLSLAVFSDPMIQGLPQPAGLLPPRDFATASEIHTQVDVSNMLKVAPYLIKILRKIKPSMGDPGDTSNNDYAEAVVNKMQNTLLRALFGDQDQVFKDSLRRPADVEIIEDTADLVADTEKDVTSEWFVGEVWSNVGWDILTKHVS